MSEMSLDVDESDPLAEFAAFDEEELNRALHNEASEVVLIEDESFAEFDEAEIMAALHQSVEPEESANLSGMQLLRRI